MTISTEEIHDLETRFHHRVMQDKGDAAAQAAFFVHPEPRIIVLHGQDLSMQANFEIHQRLVDERHVFLPPWEVTPLSDDPERARAVGAVYWQGRVMGAASDAVIKVVVGQDWIVQRTEDGLKFALYMNSYHWFLPDSAPFEIT